MNSTDSDSLQQVPSHERVLTGLPRDEMMKEYDKWASGYEEHCIGTKSKYNFIMAKTLLGYMDSCNNTLQVLDVACGTGSSSRILKNAADERGISLNLVGVDLSSKMLAEAEKKNIFSRLIHADLADKLDLPDNHFDVMIALGLFIEGHCGPDIIPNIARHLKSGGLAFFSVRQKTYLKEEQLYLNAIEKANLSVLENFVSIYFTDVMGNYLVLRKLGKWTSEERKWSTKRRITPSLRNRCHN